MSPEGLNYQRDGVQIPFVTQQQSWSEGHSYATHDNPHQPMHFGPHGPAIHHDDSSRPPVSSVDFAWQGYRPPSQGQALHMIQGHNPFCHQHGKPEAEPAMHGHACGCPQHQNNGAVPPAVPTPPRHIRVLFRRKGAEVVAVPALRVYGVHRRERREKSGEVGVPLNVVQLVGS